MMNITVPEIFAPLFLPNHSEEERKKFTPDYKDDLRRRLMKGEDIAFSAIGAKEIVLSGGRVAGKTYNDELATVPLLISHEKGDVWYCRSEENTIRKSIFSSFQHTLHSQGFTISNTNGADFKVNSSTFELRHNKTGNIIQFFAINKDINRTKSMFPPSGKLKKVMLEEANEPDDGIYIDALRTTAVRYMDEMSKFTQRYNPPPTVRAWANKYFPKRVAAGAIHINPIWEDIAALLDPPVIAEILKTKRTDPKHYAYWYGGQIVSLEGLVLYTFNRERNVISPSNLTQQIIRNPAWQPVYIIYGVDSGIVKDPTAVCAWGIFPDGKLIKLDTLYLKPEDEGQPIPNSKQVEYMRAWYQGLKNKMLQYGIFMPTPYNEAWVFDNAAVTQALMLEFQTATGFNCIKTEKKNIERDIKMLQNGYYNGFLRILDHEGNQPSFEEIETFSYDEENEIPEGQDDHTIDADKYAVSYYYYTYMMQGGLQ